MIKLWCVILHSPDLSTPAKSLLNNILKTYNCSKFKFKFSTYVKTKCFIEIYVMKWQPSWIWTKYEKLQEIFVGLIINALLLNQVWIWWKIFHKFQIKIINVINGVKVMVFNATFNNIVMVVCFIGDVTSENCQKIKRPSHHHS